MCGIPMIFSIVSQTARSVLNSFICTAHFSNNFNNVFSKHVEKIFRDFAV